MSDTLAHTLPHTNTRSLMEDPMQLRDPGAAGDMKVSALQLAQAESWVLLSGSQALDAERHSFSSWVVLSAIAPSSVFERSAFWACGVRHAVFVLTDMGSCCKWKGRLLGIQFFYVLNLFYMFPLKG